MAAAKSSILPRLSEGSPQTCFDPKTVSGVKKQMLSHEHVATLRDMFQMLGNETRIRILFALWRGESLCVCDIAHVLGMTVCAVSHQLRKLRDRKMVQCRPDKNLVYYSLADDPCLQKLLELALCVAEGAAGSD